MINAVPSPLSSSGNVSINVTSSAATPPAPATPSVGSESPLKPKRKISMNMLIGLVVLLFLVIGGISALVLMKINQDVRQQAAVTYTCTTITNQECITSSVPGNCSVISRQNGSGSCPSGLTCCKKTSIDCAKAGQNPTNVGATCCSGLVVGSGGTCVADPCAVTSAKPNGCSCNTPSQCASTVCTGGKCTACSAEGQKPTETGNSCCSGLTISSTGHCVKQTQACTGECKTGRNSTEACSGGPTAPGTCTNTSQICCAKPVRTCQQDGGTCLNASACGIGEVKLENHSCGGYPNQICCKSNNESCGTGSIKLTQASSCLGAHIYSYACKPEELEANGACYKRQLDLGERALGSCLNMAARTISGYSGCVWTQYDFATTSTAGASQCGAWWASTCGSPSTKPSTVPSTVPSNPPPSSNPPPPSNPPVSNPPSSKPSVSPSSTPVAPQCLSITKNVATPKLNDNVVFTCGNVSGATKYVFQVIEPDGKKVALNATGRISQAYKITKNGKYTAQCQICYKNNQNKEVCNGFEVLQLP